MLSSDKTILKVSEETWAGEKSCGLVGVRIHVLKALITKNKR
jgi:hypothetical protein